MSTEETRNSVQRWFDAVNSLDYATLENIASPDAMYWTSGPADKLPFCGTVTYKERIAAMRASLGQMCTHKFINMGIIAEGESAALEIGVRAEGEKGKIYENSAIVRFTVKDGKIMDVREYMEFTPFFKYLEASEST
ncbi:hypothetical protein NLJ89_g3343 [Agrocybe chaxingu]|uniref:SnoaL-like domain-containing protein n=1 Tax=Agrocybe chaxingu TaxID=84603 RepID=A0A9W8MYD5_9AGAR|nr:hypothetical protein NLJ89_g3343 [Agrocybe chaxingu]